MTINRREFIEGAGLVAGGVAATGVLDALPAEAGDLTVARVQVTAVVNGQPRDMTVEPRTTLLDALREQLHLTGTKKGCDRGECGACTVLVEGRRVLSCMSLAVMQEGKRITTIEGLERDGKLHPLQAAFIEHDGFQCGFCTSGQIMSGVALIEEARAGWPSAATADVTKPFTLADLIASGDPGAHERKSLSLRLLSQHRRGRQCRRGGGLNHARLHALESRRCTECNCNARQRSSQRPSSRAARISSAS